MFTISKLLPAYNASGNDDDSSHADYPLKVPPVLNGDYWEIRHNETKEVIMTIHKDMNLIKCGFGHILYTIKIETLHYHKDYPELVPKDILKAYGLGNKLK